MALYAFDGTWNREHDEPEEVVGNSNVKRFYDLYEGTRNVYVAGVGTRLGAIGRLVGGIFGTGGFSRREEMYRSLCANYLAGHTHINLVGFSRGAALALDFANLIADRGIRDSRGRLVQPAPVIDFIALFDLVGSFGVPINIGPLRFQEWNVGYTLALPEKVTVKHCYHALALDERRQTFAVTRVQRAYEVWFAGVHADIGGGNGNRALNDVSLRWMAFKAHQAGLPGFTPERILAATPHYNPAAAVSAPPRYDLIPDPWRPVGQSDRIHPTVVRPRPKYNDPPYPLVAEVSLELQYGQTAAFVARPGAAG